MPAFSTHYIFSDEMMETIRQRAKGVNIDERAVIYGTQGPDFCFPQTASQYAREKSHGYRLCNT